MRRIGLLLTMVAIASAVIPLLAQSPSPQNPKFEVASIRVSKEPAPAGKTEVTPGRFRGQDLALQWLILIAYSIRPDDLSGYLPSWTLSERYNIEATTGNARSEDQILLALQTPLQDRFKLRLHREMKEGPVYFLTTAKNGIKMQPGNCTAVKKDFPNECWGQRSEGLIRTLDWRGVSMSDPTGIAFRTLTGQLRLIVNRPVIDRTGLTETFDVHLRWANDPTPTTDAAAPLVNAPSIFDALEEQLGLKLESGKGPVEILVVDSVQKPTAN